MMIIRAFILLALFAASTLAVRAQEDPFTAAENAPGYWVQVEDPNAGYPPPYSYYGPPAYYDGPGPVYYGPPYYGPGIYFHFGGHGHR